MAPAAFSSISKIAKDTLGGYSFDSHKFSLKGSKIGDFGVTYNGKVNGDDFKGDVSADYAVNDDVKTTFAMDNNQQLTAKVAWKASDDLKVTASGLSTEFDNAKVNVDFANDNVNVKTTSTLAATPNIDIAVTTAISDFVVGASIGVNGAEASLSKWSAGAAYTTSDYQLGGVYNGSNLTAHGAYKIDDDKTAAAEVVYGIDNDTCNYALGYETKLTGGKAKAKMASSGLCSFLWATKVSDQANVTSSYQFDTTGNSAAKYGFKIDLSA